MTKLSKLSLQFVISYLARTSPPSSPELADLRAGSTDGETAGRGGPVTGEVGVVGLRPPATPRHQRAADPEAAGAGTTGAASQAPALCGRVANTVAGQGRVAAGIRELDHFEDTEKLVLSRRLLSQLIIRPSLQRQLYLGQAGLTIKEQDHYQPEESQHRPLLSI